MSGEGRSDGGYGDVLEVVDVSIPCVIGVYPEERQAPQSLLVSVRLRLDTRRAGHDDMLAHAVDYARLVGEVRFVLTQGRFLLIESAAQTVAATVLAGVEAIDDVTVTIKKPAALGGNGMPSLTITRHRDTQSSLWTFPFGVVEVLTKTAQLGMYRLRLRGKGAVRFSSDAHCFAIDDDRAGVDVGSKKRLDNATDGARHWLLASRPPLRLDAFLPG